MCTRSALLVEFAQQSLNGVRHLRSRAAITDGPRNRRKLAHAPPDAEVIRVDHPPVHFQLLALNTDVADPLLPPPIRPADDLPLQLLLKSGLPLRIEAHVIAVNV